MKKATVLSNYLTVVNADWMQKYIVWDINLYETMIARHHDSTDQHAERLLVLINMLKQLSNVYDDYLDGVVPQVSGPASHTRVCKKIMSCIRAANTKMLLHPPDALIIESMIEKVGMYYRTSDRETLIHMPKCILFYWYCVCTRPKRRDNERRVMNKTDNQAREMVNQMHGIVANMLACGNLAAKMNKADNQSREMMNACATIGLDSFDDGWRGGEVAYEMIRRYHSAHDHHGAGARSVNCMNIIMQSLSICEMFRTYTIQTIDGLPEEILSHILTVSITRNMMFVCRAWTKTIENHLSNPSPRTLAMILRCQKPHRLPTLCFKWMSVEQKAHLPVLGGGRSAWTADERNIRLKFMVTWREMMTYCRESGRVNWLLAPRSPGGRCMDQRNTIHAINEILFDRYAPYRRYIHQTHSSLMQIPDWIHTELTHETVALREQYNISYTAMMFGLMIYPDKYPELIDDLKYIRAHNTVLAALD
jgi:hypothetical protein